MSSGVNMLTNSRKVSDTSKAEFSELISFFSDQKYVKNTAVLNEAIFWTINMLTVHTCSDTGLFSHLSNPAFGRV